MPRNVNPWVSELLSWHGHDRGGVRVPFHGTMGKPLGHVVETSLIAKIKRLAMDLGTISKRRALPNPLFPRRRESIAYIRERGIRAEIVCFEIIS